MSIEPNRSVDDATRRTIEALSTEYSWLVDHGQADQAAGLFTNDAVLSAGGNEVSGIVDIRRHLLERANNRNIRSRHVVTNIRLLAEGPEQVRGTVIMTIYRSIGESGRPQVIIGDVEDLYRLGTDGCWRLAERKLAPAFVIGEL
jgi:ketosteroid isomerase-like protein